MNSANNIGFIYMTAYNPTENNVSWKLLFIAFEIKSLHAITLSQQEKVAMIYFPEGFFSVKTLKAKFHKSSI